MGSEKNTWEPLSHLKGAKEAVMDYNAVSGRHPVKAATLTSPCSNPIVTRVKAKATGRSKANPNVDVPIPNPESHTNPIVARAIIKAKAKAKVNPK